MKTARQLERYFKGLANHHRVEILLLVYKKEGITLEQILESLGGNQKTFSEHTRKLVAAGLLNKKYMGRNVLHALSPYGKKCIAFMKTLS